MFARVCSVSSRGVTATPDRMDFRAGGSGRRFLSTFPFGVSGMESIRINKVGAMYTCNGHRLQFQSKAAEHGAAALDVLSAWCRARSSGRLALDSLNSIAGHSILRFFSLCAMLHALCA